MTPPTPGSQLPAVSWFDSAGDVPANAWQVFGSAGAIDRSQQYRLFREVVEPGRSFVALATAGERALACATGAWTTPATALMSDPWALLTNRQFLRLSDEAADAEPVDGCWRALLRSLGGNRRATDRARLHSVLGPCLVVRSFDSSEVLLAEGLHRADRRRALAAVVARLVVAATENSAAAVAFPYVEAGDVELQGVLRAAGFVSGAFTATSIFDLGGVTSYTELEQGLPARVRRRFRREQRSFLESGLLLTDIDLAQELDTIVRLESGNVRKYGHLTADGALHRVRMAMARLLGANVRVQVARDVSTGEFAACGIDLFDQQNYLGLVYGQDYNRPQGMLYPMVSYYGPMHFAISRGIRWMRMGFEAYLPKVIRGAYVEPRQTFIWHPDPAKLQLIEELLALLSERFTKAVGGWARQQHSPGRWQLPGQAAD